MIPKLTHELAGQKIAELRADAEAGRRIHRAKTNRLRNRREQVRLSDHCLLVESKP